MIVLSKLCVYVATGGAAVMLASPEDAIADMLRTHASDDAAFVFEELMENPMEIGKEVAAFLRRRKAKKQVSPLSVNIRTFFATYLCQTWTSRFLA